MSGKLKVEEAERFWCCADENNDGQLTIQELKRGVVKYCAAQGRPPPDDKCIVRMFMGLDRSEDKSVSKQEFMEEMTQREEREKVYLRLFKELDKDGNGTLSRDEIKELFKRSKCQYSKEQIDDVINDCDTSGDGVISLEEFMNAC